MTVLSPATQRSILLLSFATFASMSVQRVCDAMLPELARVFSTSLTQAAQVISVFAMVYGLVQLLYGPLGDRMGKFRVVTFATLACSVGSLLSVFASSLDMLVVARVLVALGAAAIIPLSMAWVGDTVPYAQRQEALARVGLGTTLGIVGGQLIGAVLTDTVGWRWAFVLMTLLFTGVGWLLWLDLRVQHATSAHPSARPPAPHGVLRQAWLLLTGPWSRVVLLIALIEGASGFGVLAIWAAHLHHALGLSLTAAGAIVALFGLGGVVYMAQARLLIARLGERGMVRLGVSLICAGSLVLAFSPYWQAAIPASLLAGFGFFMFHNTMQANATQMAPHARGTGVTLFASSLFLGQSIGVTLAASLLPRIGSAMVIALGGGVLLAAGLYFAGALRQREHLLQRA